MVSLGVHVSIAGSIDQAADRAKKLGCDTFQIFTRNPRGWRSKELVNQEAKLFVKKVAKYRFKTPLAHMPYLPNLSTPKEDLYKLSVATLISELKRCEKLKLPYLVVHLGSHLGKGNEFGRRRIDEACVRGLKAASNNVMILLENTAGAKNAVGSTFEELRQLLDDVEDEKKLGVCLDTCHAFAAGYDLRSESAVNKTLDEFVDSVGADKLRAIHLNDSKGKLGDGLDRHEHIGLGHIGASGFRTIFRHPLVRKLPLVMETPVDARRDDKGNLAKARELAR